MFWITENSKVVVFNLPPHNLKHHASQITEKTHLCELLSPDAISLLLPTACSELLGLLQSK
jgi:hypothetical protein